MYVISSEGGAAAKISTWGLDYQSSLAWLDDETLVFQANDSLDDLQSPWKQTAVFTLDVDTKEITKISPESGVYNSPKPSADGKIAFLGHPSKDYSYVAFDVYLSDGKQTKKLIYNHLF